MRSPEQMPNIPSSEGVPQEQQDKESAKMEKKEEKSPNEEWQKTSEESIDLIQKSLGEDFSKKDEKRLEELKNRLGERIFDFLEEEILHAWSFLGKYQREGGKEKLNTSEIEERIQELKKMSHQDIDKAIKKMYGG